jgi:hypothetical protein
VRETARPDHPLDVARGLDGDRFRWNVPTCATKLSFAEARATLALFGAGGRR